MKILIVNHEEKECGVYKYGERFGAILSKSLNNTCEYFECSSAQRFIAKILEFKPDVIVYNYLRETMPWLTDGEIGLLRSKGIKQGLIVHNIGYSTGFDFYLHQHPDYPENGVNYPILRPLFKFREDVKLKRSIPEIGTFGFGFKIKKYEDICRLVNDQFDEANINLHLTVSRFFPNNEELEEIKNLCRSVVTKEGIKLNFTSHYVDDDQILEFLSKNDLNIFLYQYYDNYNGISSVIDYALSVNTPLAICKSNMFNHINKNEPSICVEDSSLSEIINNGFGVLDKYRDRWSHDKFIAHFEKIIERVI